MGGNVTPPPVRIIWTTQVGGPGLWERRILVSRPGLFVSFQGIAVQGRGNVVLDLPRHLALVLFMLVN